METIKRVRSDLQCDVNAFKNSAFFYSILTEGSQKWKINKEALAKGLKEFNFGSFELLHIKYGFEVEMGSPVQVSSAYN